jgi:flavin-dependent dehydrogenase
MLLSTLLVGACCVTAAPVETDLCVYGGTSGGVVTAVQATRLGKSVVIVEPGRNIGGMSSGGLSWTDFARKEAIGGLARDFYRRIGQHYGKPEHFALEPHVAEKVFRDWLQEAGVKVHFGERVVALDKTGTRISRLRTASGQEFLARMFVDATYEGDLLPLAGVTSTVIREANATYKE